jgi:hypothetical protein
MNRLSLLNDDMARIIWKLVYDSCVVEIRDFAKNSDIITKSSFDDNNFASNVSIYENKENKRKMLLKRIDEIDDDGIRLVEEYYFVVINSCDGYTYESFHEAILKLKKYKTKLHLDETFLWDIYL